MRIIELASLFVLRLARLLIIQVPSRVTDSNDLEVSIIPGFFFAFFVKMCIEFLHWKY